MLNSDSINVWLSLMQALSAVHHVFCTGLYGDDHSEGGDQQRISKAFTRGDFIVNYFVLGYSKYINPKFTMFTILER